MINWKILIPSFLFMLFLLRYYDFFYLYLPVRVFALSGAEPSLGNFLAYNYLLRVLFYLFKFPLIAAILSAGIFLEGNKNKEEIASFTELILLAVIAESVYFLSDIYKIVDFTFINPNYSLEDYTHFYPLSLFSLLETSASSSFKYLFQTLNIFELGYIACLIVGLRSLQYPIGSKAVSVTLFSYGGLLLTWALIMTFISL